jgi:hypothetical protein
MKNTAITPAKAAAGKYCMAASPKATSSNVCVKVMYIRNSGRTRRLILQIDFFDLLTVRKTPVDEKYMG